jgi:ketosteroid isomerase-like protein
MSRENVELTRRAFEAWTGGNQEVFFGVLAENVVWDLSRSSFPDARVYQGIDEVREWFRGLQDAFGDVRYEVENVRDVGAHVIVLLHVRGRGPTSQIGVDYSFVPVLTLRDEKIVRMDRYDDWAQALEAVGLRE